MHARGSSKAEEALGMSYTRRLQDLNENTCSSLSSVQLPLKRVYRYCPFPPSTSTPWGCPGHVARATHSSLGVKMVPVNGVSPDATEA